MPTILKATRFGNPILRSKTKQLTLEQINSAPIKELIDNMRYTLLKKKYGVGLAAPQVGFDVALSVIGIKPTPNRPNLTPFETVIINPEITQTHGNRQRLWEGCVSCGTGDNTLFAQVPRYRKITLRWTDEKGTKREEVLEGFLAHVAQHEVDHLSGILFVDRVKDPSTFMMADEYRRRILRK